MISYGQTEFTGRNWKTGIFGLALAIPTIIGLIPTIIYRYNGWLIVTLLFSILILFGIGIAYYSLILKKLIITNLGVQYWAGNTKKFDAAWTSINLITNDSSIVGTAKRGVSSLTYLNINADDNRLALDSEYYFNVDTLRTIFIKLVEIQRNYPHIRIEDKLQWVFKQPPQQPIYQWVN